MAFPDGLRLTVAGMGRSGEAVARAAVARGAKVTVVDERMLTDADSLERAEALERRGVTVVPGWHGRLDAQEFDVLVASPGFRREHPAILDALDGGREVISEVEFAARIAVSPIIAITGTNGKSTTTVLTYLLLASAGKNAILCGNISGSGYDELTLTEAAERAAPDDWLVAEISSYQLEWVRDFAPQVATVLNVTPDHLDRHPSFEDYRNTKLRIFGAMKPGAIAVLNSAEPSVTEDMVVAAAPRGVGLRVFGPLDLPGSIDRGSGTTAASGFSDERLLLSRRLVDAGDLPLYGHHARLNAVTAWELAVSALGAVDDATFEAMLRALLEFKGLAHRMQRLGSKAGVQFVNNSMCTNPAALVASAESLALRQHLLIGGNAKGLDYSLLRQYLRDSAHAAYVFGEISERERPGSVAAQLAGDWPEFDSLEGAFSAAVERSEPGEAVVLSPGCASGPPFANFRERGEAFSELVQRHLEADA